MMHGRDKYSPPNWIGGTKVPRRWGDVTSKGEPVNDAARYKRVNEGGLRAGRRRILKDPRESSLFA